jgi:hypothetical protein
MARIALPFSYAIPHDDIILFEVIMSVLVHWSEEWFEFYPTPPLHKIMLVDEILKRSDSDLANYLST